MYSSIFSILILVVSAVSIGNEAVDRLFHPEGEETVDMVGMNVFMFA